MTENEMNRNGNGGNTNEIGNGMNDRNTRDYGLIAPVAPEGGMPVVLGNGMENAPIPSIAPEDGAPVLPGNSGADIPVPPIAPEGDRLVFPGPDNIPVPPIAPEGRRPVAPGPGVNIPGFPFFPSFPTVPPYPSLQYFGQVCFLNASTNSFPVNIPVDNKTYAMNFRFGTISNYDWIADGFHIITVRRATGLRSILFQRTFPSMAGVRAIMILTDIPSGGLSMVKVADTGCINLPFNAGYYHFANMTYDGSNFGLLPYGGEATFRNVGFWRVTSYKQATAGSYQFYVINSSNLSVIREIPVIVIGVYTNGNMVNKPLLSLQVSIVANRNYTIYMTSNTRFDNNLRAPTVEG